MGDKIAPFRDKGARPTLAELVEWTRRLAAEGTSRLRWDHPHVQMRMTQRGLQMALVLEALRGGEGISGPKLDQWGDWRIKLSKTVAGRRIQVVVAVKETHLVIVTVI